MLLVDPLGERRVAGPLRTQKKKLYTIELAGISFSRIQKAY